MGRKKATECWVCKAKSADVKMASPTRCQKCTNAKQKEREREKREGRDHSKNPLTMSFTRLGFSVMNHWKC